MSALHEATVPKTHVLDWLSRTSRFITATRETAADITLCMPFTDWLALKRDAESYATSEYRAGARLLLHSLDQQGF